MPDKGSWYAVSSASGGFAIPVQAGSGAYTLTITSGPLQGKTATATINAASVKIDWVQAPDNIINLPTQIPVPAGTGSNQITALSTRGLVETGSNVLIGGIVIAGDGTNNKKKLLVRGVGPTLTVHGVSIDDAIGGTTLDIYDSTGTKIGANNGWKTNADGGAAVNSAAASVGDFPLLDWGNGGGDSALILSLAPGGYTTVVRPPDAAGSTYNNFVGLLEIYDLSPSTGGHLSAVSTRGHIGLGSRQMIVGCVVSGIGQKRVLVRGVGPELSSRFALQGALPNPVLTLFDSAGLSLALNDDWSFSAQTNQLRTLTAATGEFSLDEGSASSALLFLLPPGGYTGIVGAKTGTLNSGIGLLELYETP